VRQQMWFSLPFLYLFLYGHAYIVVLALASGWRRSQNGLESAFGMAGGS